jgi:hypothetical protein
MDYDDLIDDPDYCLPSDAASDFESESESDTEDHPSYPAYDDCNFEDKL